MKIFVCLLQKEVIEVDEKQILGSLRETLAGKYGIDTEDCHLYLNNVPLVNDADQLCNMIVPGSTIIVLSPQLAEEHGRNSTIRSVKSAFERLKAGDDVSDALKHGEQFSLNCSYHDLSELGAGWVLFFEFMIFAAVLCFVCLLIHKPAIILWAGLDDLEAWPAHTENNATMIVSAFMSAGNAGPRGTDSTTPALCMAGTSVAMLLMATHFNRRQEKVKEMCDAREVDPNDFAIIVKDLPTDVSDEKEVKEFVEQNARRDQDTEVVAVIMGYDVNEFQGLRMQAATTKKEQVQIQEEIKALRGEPGFESNHELQMQFQGKTQKFQELEQTYAGLKCHLASTRSLVDYLPFSGAAIVLLKSQREHRECLAEWQSVYEQFVNTIPGCACLSNRPKFRDDHLVRISRAANPTDILWENMAVPNSERLKAKARCYAGVSVIFLICFVAVWVIQWIEEFKGWTGTGFFKTITVVGANIVAAVGVRFLVLKQKHKTKTARDTDLMVLLSLFYAMTYSLVPFMVFLDSDQDWYRKGGLVTVQWMIVWTNAVLLPLFSCLGIGWRLRMWSARRIDPANSPALTQAAYQKKWEPPDVDVARQLSKGMKTFFVGLWLAPMVPWSLLVTILGLVFQYWAYKYELLRLSKRPYRQGPEVCQYGGSKLLYLAAAGFAIRSKLLLDPSLYGAGRDLLNELWIPATIVPLLMAAMPASVNKYLCCTWICQRRLGDTATEKDFYAAQKEWPKHIKYQSTNIVYQQLEALVLLDCRLKKIPAVTRWDPRTGNYPDPSEPVPEPAAAPVAPGPPVATDVAPPAATILPLPDADVAVSAKDGEEEEEEHDDALEETAAMAETCPMQLALEEEKWKGYGEIAGHDSADEETEEETETEDDSAPESGASGDEEAPISGPGAPAGYEPGKVVSMKSKQLAPGKRVRIVGLKAAGVKFNGTECRLECKSESQPGKWVVILQDGHKGNMAEENMRVLSESVPEIAVGMKVKISGLEKSKQFNNTVATVEKWDDAKSKWVVVLFTGMEARLPSDNLSPVVDAAS